ncbi:MAG: hypothetical protein D6755_10320 [Anaerolineae bacterium]|nr:MAG: hypothetical protein D6755_10320 [Anaerolineae bacterium]
MSLPFDLVLTPIQHPEALWVAPLPARVARRRERERLFLHLVLLGNAPITEKQSLEVYRRLTGVYYSTSGTASGAMRAVAQALNGWLLRRNRTLAQSGQQSLGVLTMGVLRPNGLYLGQSGPLHLLAVTAEGAVHWPPSELGGRGLGVSRIPSVRYHQVPLHPGDTLLFSVRPSPAWTLERLAASTTQSLESAHGDFASQPDADPWAVLLRAQEGRGEVRVFSGAETAPAAETQEESVPAAEAVESPGEDEPHAGESASAGAEEPPKAASAPSKKARLPRFRLPELHPLQWLAPLLLALWDGLGRAAGNTRRLLGALAVRLLPEDPALPSSMMAFIAVAVPLLVVAVASTVYFQQGKDDLYQAYYEQAQVYLAQADLAEEDASRREAWEKALQALDNAERYQVTDESQAMRQGLLEKLDTRAGIVRLDFQPAIYGGLARSIVVRRILPLDDDLYLLDERTGAVVRAQLTSRGYQVDASFRCGPTPRVGALVDIVPMPRGNSMSAVLMGMDADGNVLYCRIGEAALEAALPSPNGNWGLPRALDLYAGNLYLLDPHPRANAVWVYPGDTGTFRALPVFFFDSQVPSLEGAIDLARTPDDLYLLHSDGHLTQCVIGSGGAETRCEDPAPLRDERPARAGAPPAFEGAHFVQVQYVAPPDPALYLLDAQNEAVYLFSLQLRFLRQYRPLRPLADTPATAFAVHNRARRVFLAFGNEVYFAGLR